MSSGNFFVLVKYKSQPGKSSETTAALRSLIAKVATEPNFIRIEMLGDSSDSTSILLYEEWASENYYKGDHMATAHIQQFMVDARGFLAGPPDISFWKSL